MHQSVTRPWEFACEPFSIADNVYYVGNTWVGSFLLDSGKGLILIDCTMAETLYQVTESIRKLGFDPKNIKKILLTHAHYDHAGGAEALRQMTGAKLYLGKEDAAFIGKPELILSDERTSPDFSVDKFYNDEETIELGRFKIHAIHTPGHTPGARSMFFYAQANGKKLLCGMHGGLGFATMTDEYMNAQGLDISLRNKFLAGLYALKGLPIDIAIGSHPKATLMLERLKQNAGKACPLEDKTAWHMMLDDRIDEFNSIYPKTEWEDALPGAKNWKHIITET